MKWYYKGEVVDKLPQDCVGIVYHIFNTTKKKAYIGKKIAKNKLSKPPLKGKKRKRVTYVEKWQDYTGSNDELNADIKAGDEVVKTILHFCQGKKQMSYLETKQLFLNNVLETDGWYNGNISGKWFRTDFKKDIK